MFKTMIWAVLIKPDYMAELHYSFKNSKKAPKIVYFNLDNKLPLRHEYNRAIVNVQLSKVGINDSTFEYKTFDNGNQMMYGKFNRKVEYANDRGASLIELPLMAILIGAMLAIFLPTMIQTTNDMNAKLDEVKTLQLETKAAEADILEQVNTVKQMTADGSITDLDALSNLLQEGAK